MTDPPAPDLGAIQKRLDTIRGRNQHVTCEYTDLDAMLDIAGALLAAYAAQAARLAAVSDALMYGISIVCNVENPTVTQDEPWEPLRRRFLDQAHAAFRPPAAEMAPRQEPPGAAEDGPSS